MPLDPAYMVAFSYGSVVFFSAGPKLRQRLLAVVREVASDPVSSERPYVEGGCIPSHTPHPASASTPGLNPLPPPGSFVAWWMRMGMGDLRAAAGRPHAPLCACLCAIVSEGNAGTRGGAAGGLHGTTTARLLARGLAAADALRPRSFPAHLQSTASRCRRSCPRGAPACRTTSSCRWAARRGLGVSRHQWRWHTEAAGMEPASGCAWAARPPARPFAVRRRGSWATLRAALDQPAGASSMRGCERASCCCPRCRPAVPGPEKHAGHQPGAGAVGGHGFLLQVGVRSSGGTGRRAGTVARAFAAGCRTWGHAHGSLAGGRWPGLDAPGLRRRTHTHTYALCTLRCLPPAATWSARLRRSAT